MVSIDPSLQLKKIQLTPEEAAQNDGQRRASDATMGDNDSLFNNREVQASLGNKKASADNIFAAEDSNPFIKAGNSESSSLSGNALIDSASNGASQAKASASSAEGLQQNVKQVDNENSITLQELDSLISSVNGRQASAKELNASLQNVLDTNIAQIDQLVQTAANEQEKAEKANSDEKQANQKITQYKKELAQLDKKDSIDEAKKFSTFSLKTAAENDEDEKTGKTQKSANKSNTNAKKTQLKAKIAAETSNASKAKTDAAQATQSAQTAQTQAQQQAQQATAKADSASNFIKASNDNSELEQKIKESAEENTQKGIAFAEKSAAEGATISGVGQVVKAVGKKAVDVGITLMATPQTAGIGKIMVNGGKVAIYGGTATDIAGKALVFDSNTLANKLDKTGEHSAALGESLGNLATSITESVGLSKQIKEVVDNKIDSMGLAQGNKAISASSLNTDGVQIGDAHGKIETKTYNTAKTKELAAFFHDAHDSNENVGKKVSEESPAVEEIRGLENKKFPWPKK